MQAQMSYRQLNGKKLVIAKMEMTANMTSGRDDDS
jgi:hypothetical protein